MKQLTTFNLFIIVTWVLILASCSTDTLELDEPEIIFPDPVELLESSLQGSVEDESGLPISGAIVTCHSCLPEQEVLTDDKGDFQFLNVEVKGGSAYLSINSAGKFDGFRRLGLLEARVNYTRVLLKEKISLGTLTANQGGELIHNSGAVISLPPNGIVDAAGQSYSGDYDVFMSWIDPVSEDLNERMVGDLSAIDTDGELVGLSTYGMLQVELEAPDGSSLNLDEGSIAILEFPLPQSIRANAPTVIPLWNYDEANGYWIEEGSAILDGDKYVGEVSHFSTWNVDTKFDPVDICGSIVTGDFTKGLPYFQVNLGGDSFQSVGGWLCDDGSFRFINVPSGEELTIEILNYCGELIETINIGLYDPGKVILDPIILSDDTEITFIQLTGNVIDCDNEVVTQGFVNINLEFDFYSFPIETDGSFDVSFPTCGEFEATVQVINFVDLSASIAISISDQTEDYNLKDFKACVVIPEEYFYYQYIEGNGTQNVLSIERLLVNEIEIESTLSTNGTYGILFQDSLREEVVLVSFEQPPVPDTEQVGEIVLRFPNMGFSVSNSFSEVDIQFISVGPEIAPGIFGYIEGSFEASEDAGLNIINGTFRAKPQ